MSDYLTEDSAPGIEGLAARLGELFLMEELEPYRELQRDLMERVRRAGEQLRVLILKTPTVLPYTSVFIELQCAYWDADREEALRRRIAEEGD